MGAVVLIDVSRIHFENLESRFIFCVQIAFPVIHLFAGNYFQEIITGN